MTDKDRWVLNLDNLEFELDEFDNYYVAVGYRKEPPKPPINLIGLKVFAAPGLKAERVKPKPSELPENSVITAAPHYNKPWIKYKDEWWRPHVYHHDPHAFDQVEYRIVWLGQD
jgi:hypothetical protein